jgi:uncharacterized membrane protein
MKVVTAGTVLGVGLGGFVDGIVLHQIAQWHNMGSAVLPPVTMEAMQVNMRWDGLFHAATWIITFVGVWMLWAEGQEWAPTSRVLTGQLIFGWGGFNIVEGMIDHHLLNIHHVRDLPVHVPAYDWTFLLVAGVLFVAIGWWMASPTRTRLAA